MVDQLGGCLRWMPSLGKLAQNCVSDARNYCLNKLLLTLSAASSATLESVSHTRSVAAPRRGRGCRLMCWGIGMLLKVGCWTERLGDSEDDEQWVRRSGRVIGWFEEE